MCSSRYSDIGVLHDYEDRTQIYDIVIDSKARIIDKPTSAPSK